MHIELTPEQLALRDQLRAYFNDLMTPALREELKDMEGGGPEFHKAMHKLGADGWLGIGWPKDQGGLGRSAMDQFLFFDEIQRVGFPIPFLTLTTVGPTLMKFGSPAQKAEILPKILAGKLHFSIGYTEPEAGTDLASLKTRAVKDGNQWVINGEKVFMSLAHMADYIWLAARTNPDEKHGGISMFMMPAKTPGIEMTPMKVLGDNAVCAVHFNDVRIGEDALIGPLNGGWKLITTQLNHERVALVSVGHIARFIGEVRDWAATVDTADGKKLIDQEWVQVNLAKVYAKAEILKLLNWRQAWNIAQRSLGPAEASTLKIFGTEFYVEGYRLLLEILGQSGYLKAGSKGETLKGQIEQYYRSILVLTFGGGTNEVQRDIIAMLGLNMPRMPRM